MRRFIKKYYIQLSVIGLFAVSILVMLQQSMHVLSLIKEKSIELKQVKMDQVLAEEYMQNIHEFKKNAQYIDENASYFQVLLPNSDDDKVRLFSTLEKISQDSGNSEIVLSVKSSTAENKENKEKKETKSKIAPKNKEHLLLNITTTGSYNDLITFLYRIENMQYFSDVLSVKIMKISESTAVVTQSVGDGESDVKNGEQKAHKNLIKSEISIAFYLDGAK